MSTLSYFLINGMFIIFPFFLFQMISLRLPVYKTGKLTVAACLAFSLLGCIGFPLHFLGGYEYELTPVPLIVGTLYGGWQVGLALSLLGAAGQYPAEGAVVLQHAVLGIVLTAFVAALRAPFFASAFVRKLYWGALYSAFAAGLSYAGDALLGGSSPPGGVILYAALMLLLLLCALTVGEHIREAIIQRKEIVRMEKLTATSSLAVIIAHELRNPLTTVKGFLQLIKRQNPSEQILYYANTAMQELSEAEKVIHTYLTITTLHEAAKSEVSLSNSIDRALSDIWPLIELKKIELIDAVSEDVTLNCNEGQLQLCLMHLLRNGANALHRGGKLTISSYWKGRELAIVIADNGIGMTEEQLEELGMPKYNTRSSGTGTGLMYCYHFVHSLNGKLRIQSQPGRGTTVTVVIPDQRA